MIIKSWIRKKPITSDMPAREAMKILDEHKVSDILAMDVGGGMLKGSMAGGLG